jgi:hypothetical protein
MLSYVVEKIEILPKSDKEMGGADGSWSVLELPSRRKVGTLRRTGELFTAESEKHRNVSEAASGLLVLKMAFRSDNFFIQNGDQLQKLSEPDLK